MATTKPRTVEEYIADFPKETQKVMKQIRRVIKQAAPGAEEMISYAIPTFKLNGRPLIYFAGYEKHTAVYPAPREADEFKDELSGYKGGKGTVQFPLNKPLPLDLIARIVKYKVKETLERDK